MNAKTPQQELEEIFRRAAANRARESQPRDAGSSSKNDGAARPGLTLDGAKRLFVETARRVCPGWRVIEGHKRVLDGMVRWALGDASGPYNPGLGLWLWGDIGTGKSTLMAVLAEFCHEVRPHELRHGMKYRLPYHLEVHNAGRVCAAYQQAGYEGLEQFVKARRLCIDEIGSETIPTGYYGTPENVVQYLLQRRYDAPPGELTTFATSNLMPEQIPGLYSARIYDRCREMFNFVSLRGASLRRGALPTSNQ